MLWDIGTPTCKESEVFCGDLGALFGIHDQIDKSES
jgi:hypothetical protein